MRYTPALGIDLGTTYSVVAAVAENGQPEIIPNAQSERLTPSAVLFEEGDVIVGQIAKDATADNPENVILFIKRQMGNPDWYFSFQGHRHSPVDVSGLILRKLKQDAEAQVGQPITHAVISVPAYFDVDRRRMTRLAGEVAGLKVMKLINEPTAAAIAFGAERSQGEETILVYDLGGGTCDVTIMQVSGKDFRVVATTGDHQLGGKDFDDAIMRYAIRRFHEENGFDLTTDALADSELRTKSEKAKRELSERLKASFAARAFGKTTRVDLKRDEFSKMIQPKVDTTLALIRDVLKDARMSVDDVDRILLIGGSTRIPVVRDTLRRFFGKEIDHSVNPDEAVALGAALVAAREYSNLKPGEVAPPVAERLGGLRISDVTSHSLGIEASVPEAQRKINSILIPRNTPIPHRVEKIFVTDQPGATAIRVTILQGEFSDPAKCKPVGVFTLSGLPLGRPAGQEVRVTVICNEDGVVEVSAYDIAADVATTTHVSYHMGQAEQQQFSAKERWMKSQVVS